MSRSNDRINLAGHRLWARLSLLLLLLPLAVASLTACNSNDNRVEQAESTPPDATYVGPAHFRGTVGSLATLRNYQPLLVEGYGVVVGLEGTGSSEIPENLRQRLINDLRTQGMGTRSTAQALPEEYRDFANMSPEQLLRDDSTAIVAVQGLIPPGASQGTPFDVLVSALPETQTTSLAGGVLFTTELGVGGADRRLRFTRPRARARGPIYENPFRQQDENADVVPDDERFQRQAVVVGGGRATQSRSLELVLNQPSWPRSRTLADRINERFPYYGHGSTLTAEPQTDRLIELNIPPRFAQDPEELLELISYLYTQQGPDFRPGQAQMLGQVLEQDPDQAQAVVYAWRALGQTIRPVLRSYYEHEQAHMRLASLEAGAYLGDPRSARYLGAMADDEDPAVRERVALAMARLPDNDGSLRTLRGLLSDPEPDVRVAAYEGLLRVGDDRLIDRVPVYSRDGELKFVVDRVEADRPMVFITQEHLPRVVVFGRHLGFDLPMLAQVWDNRLMLRQSGADQALDIYYRAPGLLEGSQYQVMPTVAWLSYILGHEPTVERPHEGLGLSYGQVVEVVYRLAEQGYVQAQMHRHETPLAREVAEYQQLVAEHPTLAARQVAEAAESGEFGVVQEPPSVDVEAEQQAIFGDPDDDPGEPVGPTDFSVPQGNWHIDDPHSGFSP